MVIPEAVAKYSPFEPVILFTPAGNSNFAACVLVAEGAEADVLGVAVDEFEVVEVEADGADLVVSDFISCDEVVDVVEEDLAASLAKAGAATNAITAKASKNFFMCFSNK
jgi:hypothetical protein